MALINCVSIVGGTGGNTLNVTAAIYPNCASGYAYTTTTYILGLETQIANLQQDIATSQATTLLAQSQLGQCNTLLANPLTCSGGTGGTMVVTLPPADLTSLSEFFFIFFSLTLSVYFAAFVATRLYHFIKSIRY